MTHKRRYPISTAIFATCVGIALGVLAMLPPQPGVTKANFDRIEMGMTKEDVSGLLGEHVKGPWRTRAAPHPYFSWRANEGEGDERAQVFFQDNRVVDKWWDPFDETILDKLRRWLRLPNAAAAPVPGEIPPAPNFP